MHRSVLPMLKVKWSRLCVCVLVFLSVVVVSRTCTFGMFAKTFFGDFCFPELVY